MMLAYSVPGFVFIKTKMIDQSHIASFAKLLLYVCSPALSVYSFNRVDYSKELLLNFGWFFLLSFLFQICVLSLLWLLFRKKSAESRYRVCCVACVLGNVGFFGVPLLEALLPESPEAVAYSAVFIVGMNIISWTFGSVLLTGDKRFMSIKNIVLNPPFIALCISLPLFVLNVKLPDAIETAVSLLGRMSTPLCMLILGMRLATVKLKDLITDKTAYVSTFVKLVVFPLAALAIVGFLPVDDSIKATFYILSCCPSASVVLNLAEVYGAGQRHAANAVLISTMLCIFTIPFLMLLL